MVVGVGWDGWGEAWTPGFSAGRGTGVQMPGFSVGAEVARRRMWGGGQEGVIMGVGRARMPGFFAGVGRRGLLWQG